MNITSYTARTAVVALGLSIAAVSAPASAGATVPGGNGLVAFVSTRTGTAQIWTVDPTNGVEHDLSDGTTAESAPAWSPFGTKIAFMSGADVWVMQANGSRRVDLTASEPHADDQPTWSPDGKKIAFTSERETSGRPQIYVMNANGSHVVRISNDAGSDTDPQWSPDGKHIAFVSDRDGNDEIYSMLPRGGHEKNLTNDVHADEQPSWSPDSGSIVFQSGRPHPGSVGADLWIMDATGADPTAFIHESNGYSDGGDPAFSPDGTEIVFSANNGAGSKQLWVDGRGGGENARLTNDSGQPANTTADWQPVVAAPALKVRPHSGTPGTVVRVTGSGFAPSEHVKVTFTDAEGTKTTLPLTTADSSGGLSTTVTVPAGAATGSATIAAVGNTSALVARKQFTVTAAT